MASSKSSKPKEIPVPEKLLREFCSRKIKVDTSTGEIFVGTLLEIEENMNLSLSGVRVTFLSGHTADMRCVFIKGSKIRCISLPKSAKELVKDLAMRQLMPRRGGRGRGGYRGGRGGSSGRGFGRKY
ncbi:hypothetical protein JTE90_020128 [Oedothorax gibbosus]|uniref:Sm domain-containing protein n=1 Tax=Oedothorax gibbosus TaxID=931172 RepID=A0AAV6VQ34_9ARAC|nr:hypothetical protein JTE90_020128 [Oedothorax gibbosus]